MSFRSATASQISRWPLPKVIGIGVLVVVLFSALLGATYVVEQGRYGIVTRFGKIQDVSAAGLHFKLPFVDSVSEIPAALQVVEVRSTAVSKDIQEVTTKINVQYQIPVSVVKDYYSNYRDNRELMERSIVVPGIEAVTKTITARFTAEQLITKRDEVSRQLKETLSKHLLANAGLIVAKVDITDFGFSGSFTKAIEDKVVAEQAVLTEQQSLARQQVKAQQLVVDAKAQAEATRTTADAQSYAIKKQNENASDLTVRMIEAQAKLETAHAMDKWRPNVIGGQPLVNVSDK